MRALQSELLRLRRLHAGTARKVDVLSRRRYLSSAEQLEATSLKRRKLELKDGIARLEGALRGRPPR